MKRSLLLLSLILALPAFPQQRLSQHYIDYIDDYKDLAIEEMLKHGIPASITMAQGLLESDGGRSKLAVSGNNHFGIKCHGWQGRTTHFDDDARNECFRAYDNVKQSYEDHSRFLRSGKRYASLFRLSQKDYKGWAHGLKKAGYATNPAYASSLIRIIELYNLYLLDDAKTYDKFKARREAKRDRTAMSGDAHSIKMCNGSYYVVARRGDTFKSIGKELGISRRKLARYNERSAKDIMQDGEIVYLTKKRKKVDKSLRGTVHVVKDGESMYSIAQKYGIRVESLYKANNLSPAYELKVGDELLLR